MPLETNWRFPASNIFVSPNDGDDANAGTTTFPLASIDRSVDILNFLNSVSVRGAYHPAGGYLTGTPSLPSEARRDFIADGFAVLDGAGRFPFWEGSQAANQGVRFTGFVIINANKIVGGQHSTATFVSRSAFYNECFFKDCVDVYIEAPSSLNTFVNCSVIISLATNPITLFRHTFVGTSINFRSSGPNSILNSCFDKTSSMNYANPGVSIITLTNCAFEDNGVDGFSVLLSRITTLILQGDVDPIGTKYQDGEKFSGLFTSGNFSILFQNCFWTVDLLFNSSANEDFTLQNTPIQSKLFNSNNIIGSKNLAQYFTGLSEPFNPLNSNVLLQNVTVDPVTGSFDLNMGQTEFRVRSTDDPTKCIELPQATTLEKEAFFSMVGFSFFNGEWIQQLPFNDITNRKVRLDFLISIYDETEPNGANNPLNFSPFYDMEINQNIQLDSNMRGSGNIDADMTGLGNVSGKRFVVDFIFRTDGI